MADKKSILIQLDSDAQPSTFDAVVAIDSGVDHLLPFGGVRPEQVRDLVYGAMFTRGPKDLHRTAVFIGGRDVVVGEKLLAEVTACFTMGPLRVSVMLDANGANTTAAAAVLAAGRHVELRGLHAVVLGATGPVGQRVVRLLSREGAHVRAASRGLDRAARICDAARTAVPDASVEPVATTSDDSLRKAVDGAALVVAAGAAGATLLPSALWSTCDSLKVLIDLNAVPPLGIEGVEVVDQGARRGDVLAYGAIGVGDLKMKIHKRAVASLFESNQRCLDAEAIYELGAGLSPGRDP